LADKGHVNDGSVDVDFNDDALNAAYTHIHYGSIGHIEIEPGLYEVDGQLKKFCSKDVILKLLAKQWEVLELQHQTIDRYLHPKFIWEFGAVNA
jgi:hypothetical protein